MKNIIEDIKKLESYHLIVGILGFVSIVAPGVCVICLFKPSLIMELDVFKLLLLSASITTPVLTLNFFIVAVHTTQRNNTGPSSLIVWHKASHLLVALIILSIVCYPVLLVTYFYGLSLKTFVISFILLDMLMLLLLSLDLFKD